MKINNYVVSISSLIVSDITYVLNGWSPNTIFFLVTGLIFMYYGVPKSVYNYWGKK